MRQHYLFFMLTFSWFMYGQIIQQLDALSEELMNTEITLNKPLNDKLITGIDNQLAQAKAKIVIIENLFTMSDKKGNPFLSVLIDELKQKIQYLDAMATLKKIQKINTADPFITKERDLQLWDSWQNNQLNSMNYFASFEASSININISSVIEKRQQEQQKKEHIWLTSALNAVELTLKTVQDSLFYLGQSYPQNYENLFNEIIFTIKIVPLLPAQPVPVRSSSLATKQAPMPPFKIIENAPPKAEKSLWEGDIKFIEQKVTAAKKYASEHLSSIAQQLKEHFTSEEKVEKYEGYKSIEPIPINPSQKIVTSPPPEKIKKIVHLLYNSKKHYATLIDISAQSKKLLYCMEFLELNKMFEKTDLFKINTLQQTANLIGNMLVLNAEHILKKSLTLLAHNKTEGSLYRIMAELPTTLYTTVLTNQISWISPQTKNYYDQTKNLFQQTIKQWLSHSTLLSTQEQKDCISYTHSFLKKKSFNTVEDIIAAYVLLQSVSVITMPHQKDLHIIQELISLHTLKIVTQAKDKLLSFINNHVLKALASPFPIKKQLLNEIFMQLNSLHTLEPLILLIKVTHNHNTALCIEKDYEQIHKAMNSIYNTFLTCATNAKERSEREENLTAVKLLHKILERALTLIKPFTHW